MRSEVFNFTAAQVSYKASEDAADPQVNLDLVTMTVDFPIACFLHLEYELRVYVVLSVKLSVRVQQVDNIFVFLKAVDILIPLSQTGRKYDIYFLKY